MSQHETEPSEASSLACEGRIDVRGGRGASTLRWNERGIEVQTQVEQGLEAPMAGEPRRMAWSELSVQLSRELRALRFLGTWRAPTTWLHVELRSSTWDVVFSAPVHQAFPELDKLALMAVVNDGEVEAEALWRFVETLRRQEVTFVRTAPPRNTPPAKRRERVLELEDSSARAVLALARSRRLRRVTTLRVRGVEAEALAPLLSSPHLHELRELSLHGRESGLAILDALSGSVASQQLERLVIAGFDLRQGRLPAFPRLRSLSLSRARLDGEAATALLEHAALETLVTLRMGGNEDLLCRPETSPEQESSGAFLPRIVPRLSALRRLGLSACQARFRTDRSAQQKIVPEDLAALSELRQLEVLDLSECELRDLHLIALAERPIPTLRSMDLLSNGFSAHGIERLLDAYYAQLVDLALRPDDEACMGLLAQRPHPLLRALRFSVRSSDESRIPTMFEALAAARHPSLEILDLRYSDRLGAQALSKIFERIEHFPALRLIDVGELKPTELDGLLRKVGYRHWPVSKDEHWLVRESGAHEVDEATRRSMATHELSQSGLAPVEAFERVLAMARPQAYCLRSPFRRAFVQHALRILSLLPGCSAGRWW
ncbi:MAG: hypothetical protein RBU37_21425 [Myxococcota bacterium]|jgi:hypothetical protein|nr:hypothetical protein [Myxococcota bacterium]